MTTSPLRARIAAGLAGTIIAAAAIGAGVKVQSSSAPTATPANCIIRNASPDGHCTPGAVLPVTAKQVCVRGYSSRTRNVPASEKAAVYAEYGVRTHRPGQYEVDHLISLELGGSNAIGNLWPEAASPRPGFHEKDLVEDYLHRQVCAGAMTLAAAQRAIATNWRQFYPIP